MVIGNDFFCNFENSEILAGNLKVEIEAQRMTNALKLEVCISGTVEVECDRCLDNCPLEIDFEGATDIRVGESQGEADGDIIWISATESEIDLKEYLYESVVLSLPYQRVHGEDEDGNSLCNKDMLARFNIVSSDEFDAIVSKTADKQQDPQWSKLNELKEKLSK